MKNYYLEQKKIEEAGLELLNAGFGILVEQALKDNSIFEKIKNYVGAIKNAQRRIEVLEEDIARVQKNEVEKCKLQ